MTELHSSSVENIITIFSLEIVYAIRYGNDELHSHTISSLRRVL